MITSYYLSVRGPIIWSLKVTFYLIHWKRWPIPEKAVSSDVFWYHNIFFSHKLIFYWNICWQTMCLNTRQTRGQNGSISFIFTSKADQVVWRSPCCWCLLRRQPQSAKLINSWDVAIREPRLDLACHFWGEHSWLHTQPFGHHRFCPWHLKLVKTMKIRWIRRAIVTDSTVWIIVFD